MTEQNKNHKTDYDRLVRLLESMGMSTEQAKLTSKDRLKQ